MRKMKLGSDMGCKPASEIKASATQCSTGALLRMLRHGESQPRKQEGASHVSAARQGRRGVLDVDKSLRSSEMDAVTRDYIDSLEVNSVPWSRMFTAYGTAEHYPELLSELEQIRDIDRWKMVFNRISDFEHQSTLFPPAPFVLIFLVRHLRKLLEEGKAEDIAERMIDQFGYYIGICRDAEKIEHAHPLERFSDLLDEENLLPEGCTEEDLLAVFEDPEAVSDALFYSFYYYSMTVLSQIPDILDKYGKFSKESKNLREEFTKH